MHEAPKQPSVESRKEQKKQEYIALAEALSSRQEGFPFTDIEPEAYAALKAGDEADPGYSTPIDEMVEKFRTQGMKVVLGAHPESGNVFVLPLQSDDFEDSLHPKYLTASDDMDADLKKLILAYKE